MQWVLKILKKRLEEEKRWLSYENISRTDVKIAAGVKMAKERVPQLEEAIERLSVFKEKISRHKTEPDNQLPIFND